MMTCKSTCNYRRIFHLDSTAYLGKCSLIHNKNNFEISCVITKFFFRWPPKCTFKFNIWQYP
jgi:hypothetical protein